MKIVKGISIYAVLLLIPIIFFVYFNGKTVLKTCTDDYRTTDSIEYSIDEIKCSGDLLTISGWFIYKGDSQAINKCNKSVWIKNIDTNEFYILKLDVTLRDDVADIIEDGVDYTNSGFEISQNINDISEYGTEFEMYLCYTRNGVNYLRNTNQKIKLN